MTALVLQNISKTHGTLQTLDRVNLTVAAGERVALLGHNGAGKTTLMRLILGLSPVSSGSIAVLGARPGARHARSRLGFLPENVAFHGALSGREQLHHFARLKSVGVTRADDLLERVGLGHAADRKIRSYSKGMRQKIGLAQALLGHPRLVLLDEPTSGLDPVSRHEFYDILRDLAQDGTAVLLSSHALTEIETKADRMAILCKGRLMADDTLPALRRSAGLPIRIRLTTLPEHADRVAGELGGTRVNGRAVELTCPQDAKLETLGKATALGRIIEDIEISPPSLEQLYRHYSHPVQEPE